MFSGKCPEMFRKNAGNVPESIWNCSRPFPEMFRGCSGNKSRFLSGNFPKQFWKRSICVTDSFRNMSGSWRETPLFSISSYLTFSTCFLYTLGGGGPNLGAYRVPALQYHMVDHKVGHSTHFNGISYRHIHRRQPLWRHPLRPFYINRNVRRYAWRISDTCLQQAEGNALKLLHRF